MNVHMIDILPLRERPFFFLGEKWYNYCNQSVSEVSYYKRINNIFLFSQMPPNSYALHRPHQ